MLKLAWRNVWRNKRRSAITVASIACGLAAIMFGQSMIKSIQLQLVEKATGIIIGHIRVMTTGNDDPKIPDKPIRDTAAVARVLEGERSISAFEPRILITGLVASPATSKGALVIGTDPERDPRITTISSYLKTGRWMRSGAREIVFGSRMAKVLDVRLGEKVVIMAQASDGSMGAEAFRLVGVYESGSQSFDAQIVYIPVAALQELLVLGDRVTDFIIKVKDPEEVDAVRARIASALQEHKDVVVHTWREVDREIVGIQNYQNALLLIVLGVVFAIVALGILNTLLMSLFERVREFGVLMAIGAKPRTVMAMVIMESLLLGGVGLILGVGLGSALIVHFGRAGLPLPIGEAIAYFMPFDTVIFLRFSWGRHWYALVTVIATCVLAALPPALRAARLKPAEALRHV